MSATWVRSHTWRFLRTLVFVFLLLGLAKNTRVLRVILHRSINVLRVLDLSQQAHVRPRQSSSRQRWWSSALIFFFLWVVLKNTGLKKYAHRTPVLLLLFILASRAETGCDAADTRALRRVEAGSESLLRFILLSRSETGNEEGMCGSRRPASAGDGGLGVVAGEGVSADTGTGVGTGVDAGAGVAVGTAG